jgi:hypothetical protein
MWVNNPLRARIGLGAHRHSTAPAKRAAFLRPHEAGSSIAHSAMLDVRFPHIDFHTTRDTL